MSIFNDFSIKSINEVQAILIKLEHDSILKWLIELNGVYTLKTNIENISQLPTYRFAIACTLAALGNYHETSSIYPSENIFINNEYGDNESKTLFHHLKY